MNTAAHEPLEITATAQVGEPVADLGVVIPNQPAHKPQYQLAQGRVDVE
jgi:hypothetical protein